MLKFDNHHSLKKWYKRKTIFLNYIAFLISPIFYISYLIDLTSDLFHKIGFHKISRLFSDSAIFIFIVFGLSSIIIFSIIENFVYYKKEVIIENNKEYIIKHYINGTKRYFYNNQIHRENKKAVIVKNWQAFDFFIPDEEYYMCGKIFKYVDKEHFNQEYLKLKINKF